MQNWNDRLVDFENYLRFERQCSENTITSYQCDVGKLRLFVEENYADLSPEKISYEQLQEFLYQTSGDASNERSQARLISGIKTFFKYLRDDDFREDNPAKRLQTPKLGLYLPDTLSLEDINKLSKTAAEAGGFSQRNACIVEVLYGCGLRVSELTGLKISDIHFREKFLVVHGKGNKSRLVPLADYTARLIKEYIYGTRQTLKINPKAADILFLNASGNGLTRVMIFTIIKKLAIQADIRKKISPHTFRHSYATHLLQNGADLRFIQEMLGHANIVTTSIYTHLQDEDLRHAIMNYHPRNMQKTTK